MSTIKKPATAYNLLTRDQSIKDKIKAEHPDWVYSQYMSEYARLWNGFTSEQKLPYQEKANLEKKAYLVKIAEDDTDTTQDQRLKRPTTAFIQFSNSQRAKIKTDKPELSVTEVSKELGLLWSQMSEEERKPYEDMHLDDKKRLKENPEYVTKKKKKIEPGMSSDEEIQKYLIYVQTLRRECRELTQQLTAYIK